MAQNWTAISSDILNRVAIVSEAIFSHLVNANLEVRTSVSIDPETGAAQSGALFTYEAIPRATVLTFDVLEDDYRKNFRAEQAPQGHTWSRPLDVVGAGLKMVEWLGVGGMGTRGFGRMKVCNL